MPDSRKHISLLLFSLLLAALLFLAACERKLPDIPFSGARATYELTHDPNLTLPGQENWTSTPDSFVDMETGTKTPESLLGVAEAVEEETQTPVKKDDSQPAATKTPSPTVERPYISFVDYWKGTWFIWFEDAGRLLEAGISFEEDGNVMVAKVEMAGHIYGFTLENNGEDNVYKTYFKGTWQSDLMEKPETFNLWPQNEIQAAGYHSQPVKTFCATRDKNQRPDPCFLWREE